jgi:hypothetical protein
MLVRRDFKAVSEKVKRIIYIHSTHHNVQAMENHSVTA